jgi:nitronate monooxygenase
LGACGVSVGSPFIASDEAPISQEYKEACVQAMAKKTSCERLNYQARLVRLSIRPMYKEIGLEQNWLERVLSKNKTLKKYVKMITFYKGMKQLEAAAFSATYQTMWCAGKSIEHVHAVQPIDKIVAGLVEA